MSLVLSYELTTGNIVTGSGSILSGSTYKQFGPAAVNQNFLDITNYFNNYTPGSILFAGTDGGITQDNDKLFWDAVNYRLGIGTAAPSTFLHLYENSASTVPQLLVEQDGTGVAGIGLDSGYVSGSVYITEDGGVLTMKYSGLSHYVQWYDGFQTYQISSTTSCQFNMKFYEATTADLSSFNFYRSHTNTVDSVVTTLDTEAFGQINGYGVSSSVNVVKGASITIRQDGAAQATGVPTNMIFHTSGGAISTQNNNHLVLHGVGGTIGMGTETPGYNLHIYENAASTDAMLMLEQDSATGDSAWSVLQTGGQQYIGGLDITDGYFKINAGASLGAAQQFVMTPTGLFGIGTPVSTAPASLLEVYGAASSAIGTTITNASDNAAADAYLAFRTDATPTQKAILGIDSTDNTFRVEMGAGALGARSDFVIDGTTGFIGVGAAPTAYARLYSEQLVTNLHGYRAVHAKARITTTTTALRSTYGMLFEVEATAATGTSNTGVTAGIYGNAYTYSGHAGRIAELYAGYFRAGAYVGAGGFITRVASLYTKGWHQAATVTIDLYADLYIDTPTTGCTVTADWCIYSLHDAPSQLINNLRIASDTYGLVLGAGQDASLVYDGTNLVVNARLVGSGNTLFEQAIKIKEQAAADADTAAYGQLWVKNATPNELWFTDDAGTDHQVAFV